MTKELLIITFLILFQTVCYKSQDSLSNRLRLTSEGKTITFDKKNVLILWTGDSTFLAGRFLYKDNKNIYIKPRETFLNGSQKIYPKNTDSIININLKNINRVTLERQIAPRIGTIAMFAFIGTGLVLSPILAIDKTNGFDRRQFFQITGASLGGILISAAVVVFSIERNFDIKPKTTSTRTWSYTD